MLRLSEPLSVAISRLYSEVFGIIRAIGMHSKTTLGKYPCFHITVSSLTFCCRDNIDSFIRFVNLMINDVTYLMDESLSDLTKIHEIQTEMADTQTFASQTPQYRREREGHLRSLERQAIGYTQLGNSTVALLKDFTGETKEPFMVPEIVNKLAAMLDYNLDALVGPKCQDLRVQNPEKYKFNPKQLLSDIFDVYINLSDQGEFVQAVAADGRSYRKELFERAAGITRKRGLKSGDEIEKLRLFVVKVEEAKATLEAEEDLGEIPEEFTGECPSASVMSHSPYHMSCRSPHVHAYAKPCLASHIPYSCGPINNQVAATIRPQGSLQSTASYN